MACQLEDIDVASLLEQNCFCFFHCPPPYFKMAGNSFKQRYFGSLSARHPYLSPQVCCGKEKCSGDNLRCGIFLTAIHMLNRRNQQKSPKRHKLPLQKRTQRSLYSFRNSLKHCMFWTCAICDALGMANCSLAGFRPTFRQKILSITHSHTHT